ncbi:MAG: MarR family transcriptional regulator [Acidimicrobiales bacterium]
MARRAASTAPDIDETAESLRFSLARLARLLRQQDQSGMAPALATALASIGRDGPLTLSRLAALEQVTPPTVTKLVDRLVERGYIERLVDPGDRRVCRVRITEAGVTQLADIRARRTEWLSARLRELPPDDLVRLHDVVEVLDHLVRPPEEPS